MALQLYTIALFFLIFLHFKFTKMEKGSIAIRIACRSKTKQNDTYR
jgi:hypothetical protein